MPVALLQTKPVGVTAFALCKGWHWFPSLFTWLRRRLDRSIKSLRCNIKENNCYLSLTYIIESNPNQPESADKILTRKLNAFYFLEAELSWVSEIKIMFVTFCLRNCLLSHDIVHTPLIWLLQLREGKIIPQSFEEVSLRHMPAANHCYICM